MKLAPGTQFTVDDDSTVGYTFTVRQVVGSELRIVSCDAVEKRGRGTMPVIGGFPECAIEAWEAAGKVRIKI